MFARAVVAGMQQRGEGTIINVAGMIAFSGPAPHSQLPRRVVYAGTLAYLVAMAPDAKTGQHYYAQIMIPGAIVGLLVGYATSRYGGNTAASAA